MANSRGAEVVLLRWSPEENPAVGVVRPGGHTASKEPLGDWFILDLLSEFIAYQHKIILIGLIINVLIFVIIVLLNYFVIS